MAGRIESPTEYTQEKLVVTMRSDLLARLRQVCYQRGITVSGLVRSLIIAEIGLPQDDPGETTAALTSTFESLVQDANQLNQSLRAHRRASR
jgi:hypothetical protein